MSCRPKGRDWVCCICDTLCKGERDRCWRCEHLRCAPEEPALPRSVQAAQEETQEFLVTPERAMEVANLLLPVIQSTLHRHDVTTVEALAGLGAIVMGAARESRIPVEQVVENLVRVGTMVEVSYTAGGRH